MSMITGESNPNDPEPPVETPKSADDEDEIKLSKSTKSLVIGEKKARKSEEGNILRSRSIKGDDDYECVVHFNPSCLKKPPEGLPWIIHTRTTCYSAAHVDFESVADMVTTEAAMDIGCGCGISRHALHMKGLVEWQAGQSAHAVIRCPGTIAGKRVDVNMLESNLKASKQKYKTSQTTISKLEKELKQSRGILLGLHNLQRDHESLKEVASVLNQKRAELTHELMHCKNTTEKLQASFSPSPKKKVCRSCDQLTGMVSSLKETVELQRGDLEAITTKVNSDSQITNKLQTAKRDNENLQLQVKSLQDRLTQTQAAAAAAAAAAAGLPAPPPAPIVVPATKPRVPSVSKVSQTKIVPQLPVSLKHAPWDRVRQGLRLAPSSVCVVTVSAGNFCRCATVGTFAGISSDPAVVSVSLQKDSRVMETISNCSSYAVHVLAENQAHIAAYFAKRSEETPPLSLSLADGVPHPGLRVAHLPSGLPLLRDCLAVFLLRPYPVLPSIDVGDHTLVFGLVADVQSAGDEAARVLSPLIYQRGGYHVVGHPCNPPQTPPSPRSTASNKSLALTPLRTPVADVDPPTVYTPRHKQYQVLQQELQQHGAEVSSAVAASPPPSRSRVASAPPCRSPSPNHPPPGPSQLGPPFNGPTGSVLTRSGSIGPGAFGDRPSPRTSGPYSAPALLNGPPSYRHLRPSSPSASVNRGTGVDAWVRKSVCSGWGPEGSGGRGGGGWESASSIRPGRGRGLVSRTRGKFGLSPL